MILLYEVDGSSSIVNYQIYIKTGIRNTPNEKSTCISQMLFTISINSQESKAVPMGSEHQQAFPIYTRQIGEMRIEIWVGKRRILIKGLYRTFLVLSYALTYKYELTLMVGASLRLAGRYEPYGLICRWLNVKRPGRCASCRGPGGWILRIASFI